MVSQRLVIVALVLCFGTSQLRGEDSDRSWIVDNIQFARLSATGFDSDCECRLASCPACQKSGKYNGGEAYDAYADGIADETLADRAPVFDDSDLIASNYGATPGSRSAAPAMIGDFFGGTYKMTLPALHYSMGPSDPGPVNVPVGGGDRRFKLAENNSPFPVDRYFLNYNNFHNALTTVDGRQANLNRAVFGLEKTFYDGRCSLEVRVPFSNGLNADQINDSLGNNVATEFGNVAFAMKALLYGGPTLSFSAGMGLVIPTASDSQVFEQSGRLFLTVENRALYIQPFVGMLWTPNDRLFGQFITQFDFDATGNRVRFDGTGGSSGIIQDQTLLFLDASFGYWLYRNRYSDSRLTGIAPMFELHYSTTIDSSDVVADNLGDMVSNPNGSLQVLNVTGGLRVEIRGNSYLTFAGVAPLRGGADHLFDAEFAAQYVGLY
jgi:hypothetical protein